MINSFLSFVNPFTTVKIIEQDRQVREKGLDDIHLEVGAPNTIVDGIRNFLSIPQKLLLWNSSLNSGNVSPDTIKIMKEYLNENNLHDVHVSVNQYKPQDVWKRTFTNPKTSLLSKLTLGIVASLVETLAFPKLIGVIGDHYNPLSNTVYLFSNDKAVALHECGHAKDFNSRENPTLYNLLKAIPYVGSLGILYQEYMASSDTLNYLREKKSNELLSHSFKVLVPAYASYCAHAILPDLVLKILEVQLILFNWQQKYEQARTSWSPGVLWSCYNGQQQFLQARSSFILDSRKHMLGLGVILLAGHLAGRILAANVQSSETNPEADANAISKL